MALDKVENNGFLEGFENDSIIRQDLQKIQCTSKRKNNIRVWWILAIPD